VKFPNDLGPCVDLAYKLRADRLAIEKKAEAIKTEETKLKDHIINTFSKSTIEGAKGKVAQASITRVTVANIKDWTRFMEWVSKKKAYDMLKRGINDKAYRSRLEAKEAVPGVEPFDVLKLSITKRGKR
jgi:hypothetical protein